MNFFSTHYEKVILLSFLILFIVLLLLQVNFMQNVQNQKINAIMNKVEPQTDQTVVDFNKPEFKLDNVFRSTALWNKGAPSATPYKTQLLSCFELAVCPFCGDLIHASYFPTPASPTTKKCPVCGEELKAKMKRSAVVVAEDKNGPDPNSIDKNNNSVPDNWENAHKLYSSSANDIDRDHDGDNFTSWEEYKLGTNPRNAKSHPAYIRCISFVRLNVTKFENLRFRGVYSHKGTDVNQWQLRMEHQLKTDVRRRLSSELKVGSTFEHGNDRFEILKCYPDDINDPGRGTYVTIRRVGTKDVIRCDYLQPVYDPIQSVTFQNSHPQGTFECKIGDTFSLGNSRQGVEQFKLLSATQASAKVQNVRNKKQIYTIRSVQMLKEVEPRAGSAQNVDSAPAGDEFKPMPLDERDTRRPGRRRRGGRR